MKILETGLDGVLLVETVVHNDDRGFFREVWHEERYRSLGLNDEFVQDNVSLSAKTVLRGLHYQTPQGQGKLVSVLEGAVWDVAVDIRVESPTFGQWFGTELSAANGKQMFIPSNFAHGFMVTSDRAMVTYKCTDLYRSEQAGSIIWNEPIFGISWPCTRPSLSTKDAAAPRLRDIDQDLLPTF